MIARSRLQAATLDFYRERMLIVLAYIQERLDEPLELEELARRGGLSPFHFHRVFRGMLGEPLMTHVRRLRLERAAERLHGPRRRVIEIAVEAGYDSHEAFTRAFKQAFGVSPTQFRASRLTGRAACRSGVHYGATIVPRNFLTSNQTLRAMNVTIESIAPQRVAFLRHVGPYDACGATWDKLGTWLGKEGYLGVGVRMLGICYDDPESTPPDRIRYDACVTVDDDFQPQAEIGVQTVAGGVYARVTHAGPYQKLGETYARLMGEWLPSSGHRARDLPCFEVYLNDPATTDPEDLLADIYLPLKNQ